MEQSAITMGGSGITEMDRFESILGRIDVMPAYGMSEELS